MQAQTKLTRSTPQLMEKYTPTRLSNSSNTTTTITTATFRRGRTDSDDGPRFRSLTGPSPAEGAQKKSEAPKPVRPHCDAHFHHTNYTQQGSKPQDLLPAMDAIGVLRTTLVPIPTNQLGSCHGVQYHPAKGEASNAPNY